ncbi:MAG: right-handed parallel beta-helix repeat-containing protein [Bacteroidetes bacterium]|nr:right-handed parallel beta-helix repeat-containing protein [Bacteroidota bacterium]
MLSCKPEGALATTNTPPQAYYFDAQFGNDANNGLSAEQPFASFKKLSEINLKSGDSIRLSNGSSFRGQLSILGFTGADGLNISNYQPPGSSSQQLPRIDAAGYDSGIYIENSSNISISNLSITANGGGIKSNHGANTEGMRCGILVHIQSNSVFNNLSIENVEIEGVYYEAPGFSRDKDEVTTPNGTQSYGWGIRFLNTSTSGQLTHISVSNCNIKKVSHSGIRFNNSSQLKFEDIQIHNNRLNNIGGPGMVLLKCENAVVTENHISYSGSTDDSRNWGRGSGLWTWGSSKILIDQNTFSHANGPADSAGCHIDFNCNDIIVQRNLSWSNAGGFIEVLGNNYNCAYRYNLSINDGYRVKGVGNNFQEGKTFWLSGYAGKNNSRTGPFNTYIYNNTIYTKASIVSKIAVDKVSHGVLIANNIFHVEGDSQLVLGDQYRPDQGGEGTIDNVTFSNNIFLKRDYWPEEALIQPNALLEGDAMFLKKGGTFIQDYTPTNTALVRNKGIAITTIEGDEKGLYLDFAIDQDLLGNPIEGLPDLGAIEMD